MTILAGFLMMFTGIFAGSMGTKQTVYCKCFHTNFDGQYCQSIKGDESIGSCKE